MSSLLLSSIDPGVRRFDANGLIRFIKYIGPSPMPIYHPQFTLPQLVFFGLQSIRVAKHEDKISNQCADDRNAGKSQENQFEQLAVNEHGRQNPEGHCQPDQPEERIDNRPDAYDVKARKSGFDDLFDLY
jgi:hypothetical protein